jgi:hypothetical protein
MAAGPGQQTQDAPPETLEQRFRRLEATWLAEVGHHSSPSRLINHPAFQEIIRLGSAVIPLLLGDLEQRPRLWVWALADITHQDPVPEADRGDIGKMSAAWLRWGRANGYQW